jgi:hypothetical protein
VIDGYGVERILWPSIGDFKGAARAYILRAQVVENYVVDASTSTCQSWRSTIAVSGNGSCHPNSSASVRNTHKADRYIGQLTDRTNVLAARRMLILGSEQNAIAGLAIASPAVLHKICFN